MNRLSALHKIQREAPEYLAKAAATWLSDGVEDAAEKPGEVTVLEAAGLWRIRQKNLAQRGKKLTGANEFLERLAELNERKKLKQFSFHGRTRVGNIFFEKANGRFVGLVIIKKVKETRLSHPSYAKSNTSFGATA